MEKVTIEKIIRDDVETKFGKGVRTSIYTTEFPGQRMTSFKKVPWKEGDVVMITMKVNGNFTNFIPGDTKSELEARVEKLEKAVFGESHTREDIVKVNDSEARDYGDFQ